MAATPPALSVYAGRALMSATWSKYSSYFSRYTHVVRQRVLILNIFLLVEKK